MEIFASSGLTLWVALISLLISWGRRENKRSEEAKAATFEDCDARDAWFEWLRKNGDSRSALKSQKAQEMMQRVVLARIRWKQTHPGYAESDPFDMFILMPKT